MGTWQDSALPLVQRYGISVVLVLTSITHTTLLWSLPQKEKRFSINAKIPGCSTVSRGGTEYVCAFLAILTYNPMPDTARGSEFKVQRYGTVRPSCVHTTCNTMYFSKVHFGRQESFPAFGHY